MNHFSLLGQLCRCLCHVAHRSTCLRPRRSARNTNSLCQTSRNVRLEVRLLSALSVIHGVDDAMASERAATCQYVQVGYFPEQDSVDSAPNPTKRFSAWRLEPFTSCFRHAPVPRSVSISEVCVLVEPSGGHRFVVIGALMREDTFPRWSFFLFHRTSVTFSVHGCACGIWLRKNKRGGQCTRAHVSAHTHTGTQAHARTHKQKTHTNTHTLMDTEAILAQETRGNCHWR